MGGFHGWAYGQVGENGHFKSSQNFNRTWESKVLYQTTLKLKVFFLTRIGVGVARHFRFDVTSHGKGPFMCL
jgi:hypothetical protein